MSKSWELKKRRKNLWEENPHCYWCGREIKLLHKKYGGHSEPDQATIDHFYHRFDSRRYINGQEKYVLACYECTWKRGLESQKAEQAMGNPAAFDTPK